MSHEPATPVQSMQRCAKTTRNEQPPASPATAALRNMRARDMGEEVQRQQARSDSPLLVRPSRLRGQVEMARQIDANLTHASAGDARDSDEGNIQFDDDDLSALGAFSSLFGRLPAVRLGLVNLHAGATLNQEDGAARPDSEGIKEEEA